VTSAKAIGGGLVPLGAMIMTDEAAGVFTPGTHASTFGGNGLAVASGLAVAELLSAESGGSDDVLGNVGRRGGQIVESLREVQKKYPRAIGEVRGKGLLIGVKTLNGITAM